MFQASDSNDRIISVVRSLAIQEVQWRQTKQSLRKHKSHVLFKLLLYFLRQSSKTFD